MKTKITKKFIREVLRMRGCGWHDRRWHDFMAQAEVEAVEYGIRETAGSFAGLDGIKEEAERYLTALAEAQQRAM